MGPADRPVTGTNWEGVGVKPDVEVPAGQALARAWSLAAARLKSSATDPQARACLDVLAQARLDGPPSLALAQLVGRLCSQRRPGQAGPGNGPTTIVEKDGRLYQQQATLPRGPEDVSLVPAGGDRYAPEGD